MRESPMVLGYGGSPEWTVVREDSAEDTETLVLVSAALIGAYECPRPVCHRWYLGQMRPLPGTHRRLCEYCHTLYKADACGCCGDVFVQHRPRAREAPFSLCETCRALGDMTVEERATAVVASLQVALGGRLGGGFTPRSHYDGSEMGSWQANAYRLWEDGTDHLS